jgi:hypothetical protein
MLALRLADEAARYRRERGGIICPWEVEGKDDDLEEGPTALARSRQEASNGEEYAGRSELAVREAGPNDPSAVSQTGSLENSGEELFPERIHAVIFPQIDRPLRTGRRRETGFPGPVTAQTISHTIDQLIAQERTVAGQGYFHTPQELFGLPEATKKPTGIWGFEGALVKRFPALLKRNFACVQEHQATGELSFPHSKACLFWSAKASSPSPDSLPFRPETANRRGHLFLGGSQGFHRSETWFMALRCADSSVSDCSSLYQFCSLTWRRISSHPISYTVHEGESIKITDHPSTC